jgi:SAM-dependent methyltransferase
MDRDEESRRLAAAHPTAWFEPLYRSAERGEREVPWGRGGPHPKLAEWVGEHEPRGRGRRALVVGSGLGDDAEFVAGLGFETVAFDVAPTAVAIARRRFPGSAVEYIVADLLEPPAPWHGAFDFVVEALTVQSLPDSHRPAAIENVRSLVAPGGTLLVIANARDERDGPVDGPPWPLTRAEVDAFSSARLQPVRIEDLREPEQPSVRRWRAEFLAAGPGPVSDSSPRR